MNNSINERQGQSNSFFYITKAILKDDIMNKSNKYNFDFEKENPILGQGSVSLPGIYLWTKLDMKSPKILDSMPSLISNWHLEGNKTDFLDKDSLLPNRSNERVKGKNDFLIFKITKVGKRPSNPI